MDSRIKQGFVGMFLVGLLVGIGVAVAGEWSVPSSKLPEPEQLCIILTHDSSDISLVNTLHVCTRQQERLTVAYGDDVIVLSWVKGQDDRFGYVLEYKLMRMGGEMMGVGVNAGSVVRFPSVPGFAVTVAGKNWEMARLFAVVK